MFRQTYQSQLWRDSLLILCVPVESQEPVQLRHHDSNTEVESQVVGQTICDETKQQLDFKYCENIPSEKHSSAKGVLHLEKLGNRQ